MMRRAHRARRAHLHRDRPRLPALNSGTTASLQSIQGRRRRRPITLISRSRRRSAACTSTARVHCCSTSSRYRSRSNTIRSSSSLPESESIRQSVRRVREYSTIHPRARATPERARRTVIRRSTARVRPSRGSVVVSLRVRAASTHDSGRASASVEDGTRASRIQSRIEAFRNADSGGPNVISIDRSIVSCVARRRSRLGGVSA